MLKSTVALILILILKTNCISQEDIQLVYGQIMQNAQKEMFCETSKYLWLKHGYNISIFNCEDLIKNSELKDYNGNINISRYDEFGGTINQLVKIAIKTSYLPYNINNLDTNLSGLVNILTNFTVDNTNDKSSKELISLNNKLLEIKKNTLLKTNKAVIQPKTESIKDTSKQIQKVSKSEIIYEETWFIKFLKTLIHIIIVIGLISLFAYLLLQIILEKRNYERFIKILAMVLAILIYFAIKIINFSIPGLILNSLEPFNVNSIGIYGISIPILFGFITTWLMKTLFNSNYQIMSRILILYASFVLLLFTDTYIFLWSNQNTFVLLPNVCFLIGILIYFIFTKKIIGNEKQSTNN